MRNSHNHLKGQNNQTQSGLREPSFWSFPISNLHLLTESRCYSNIKSVILAFEFHINQSILACRSLRCHHTESSYGLLTSMLLATAQVLLSDGDDCGLQINVTHATHSTAHFNFLQGRQWIMVSRDFSDYDVSCLPRCLLAFLSTFF